ncbi:hypothetical protein CA54_10360 [Symmachiella macrocystis]|uniref:Uncharacterized protein n=1 Tax=Symmachiella macrocystis TaxID=2527985 RepID=A0A5C6BKP5_9PLAN|nr:hypothetical protein CA54_10360 [Symmachiella macrocystis]
MSFVSREPNKSCSHYDMYLFKQESLSGLAYAKVNMRDSSWKNDASYLFTPTFYLYAQWSKAKQCLSQNLMALDQISSIE